MDKDLEKILSKANKKDKAIVEEVPRTFPISEPYDHLVFTKLTRFSGFQKAIFFIILPGGISTLFFFKDMASVAILCLAIYAFLILIYAIINYFRFLKFKGWQERLPFPLEGFSEMIRAKKMFCDLCWNDTRIIIETNAEEDVKRVITAALKIFSERAEMAFYTQDAFDSGTRSRKSWSVTSTLTAEGSANPEVMRYMKDLFEGELSTISLKTKSITKVKVELLSAEYQIKIRMDGGD